MFCENKIIQIILKLLFFLPFVSLLQQDYNKFHNDSTAFISKRFELSQSQSQVEVFLSPLYTKPLLLTRKKKKRSIQFQNDAFCHLNVLFVVPVSLIIPIMPNYLSEHTSSIGNGKNKNKNVEFKRSISFEDKVEECDEEDFDDHEIIKRHLDKIKSYFDLLKITQIACKQRAICEFSAEPQKFYPLSELILDTLRLKKLEHVSELEDKIRLKKREINEKSGLNKYPHNEIEDKRSLYKLYIKAGDQGFINGQKKCKELFHHKCNSSLEQRVDMKILKFWSFIYKFTGLGIKNA